jgi:hypothetical protein
LRRSDWNRLFRVLAVACAVAIAFLSLSPDQDSVDRGVGLFGWMAELFFRSDRHTDKFAHLFAYACLSAAAVLGFRRQFKLLILILLLLTYGALLEAAQSFTSVRTMSLLDLAANLTGILAGIVGAFILRFLAFRRLS